MLSVSILIPTLNAEDTLRECLESIFAQDYPAGLVEIIIADANSKDNTLAIIAEYKNKNLIKLKVVDNPLLTAEAGKAIGLRYAKGDIVALIDSDNILPQADWLRLMLAPFSDKGIVATEPLEYTWRPQDGYITRYCALMGMNDPLCYFLGNYDRYNYISGKWTALKVHSEDKGPYLTVSFTRHDQIPTLGANGFCIRRKELLKVMQKDEGQLRDYLFDIDILPALVALADSPVKVAKVKVGLVHIFSGSLKGFVQKQQRRIQDYLFFSHKTSRIYPWHAKQEGKLYKFILSCVFILPLFIQAGRGYLNKPERAWFFHPLACLITLVVYGWGLIMGRIRIRMADRKDWDNKKAGGREIIK